MSYRSILSAMAWSMALAAAGAAPAWAAPESGMVQYTPPDTKDSNLAQEGGVISAIRIEGNERTENSTVLSYLGLKPGDHFVQSDIDAGLKNLFATGFFSDVKLLRQGDTLVVRVVENPVISKVVFEGNDKIETKEPRKGSRAEAALHLFAG